MELMVMQEFSELDFLSNSNNQLYPAVAPLQEAPIIESMILHFLRTVF